MFYLHGFGGWSEASISVLCLCKEWQQGVRGAESLGMSGLCSFGNNMLIFWYVLYTMGLSWPWDTSGWDATIGHGNY